MSVAGAFADPNPARTQLRVATLDAWARAGVEMADRVAHAAGRDIFEVVRIVARLIQAVRLAIVLATRLSDPTNPAFQPTPARARAASAEREQVEKRERERPESERHGRSREREVSDAAILRRPLRDIIKVICRNLGIVPDWSLWTDEAEPPPPAIPSPRAEPAAPEPRAPASAGRLAAPRARPTPDLDQPDPTGAGAPAPAKPAPI